MRSPTVDRPVVFFRSGVACALSLTEDGVYWGHIGVEPVSAMHGCIFVNTPSTRLYKVPLMLGNPTLDAKWWFGFEGSRPYSYTATLAQLKQATDHVARDSIPEAV